MESNKTILILSLSTLLLFIKCTSNSPTNYITNNIKSFNDDVNVIHLTSHFPKEITILNHFENAPPSSDCFAQNGYVYLIQKKSIYKNEFDSVEYKIIYKTKYTDLDKKTIISFTNFKKNISIYKNCNKLIPNTIPIPNFETFDFNLGKSIIKEKGYYFTRNIFPNDLEVYVIDAKYGNFFKKKCDNKRPESLKEWRHGYSRGIAVSDKENLIVFWSMIW